MVELDHIALIVSSEESILFYSMKSLVLKKPKE